MIYITDCYMTLLLKTRYIRCHIFAVRYQSSLSTPQSRLCRFICDELSPVYKPCRTNVAHLLLIYHYLHWIYFSKLHSPVPPGEKIASRSHMRIIQRRTIPIRFVFTLVRKKLYSEIFF